MHLGGENIRQGYEIQKEVLFAHDTEANLGILSLIRWILHILPRLPGWKQISMW